MAKYRKHLKSARRAKWKKTLRLIFEYNNGMVRPVSSQSVQMIPPASAAPRPKVGQPGFWYELHNAKGHVLYFRVIRNPISFDAEVFSKSRESSISRREVTPPKEEFELLVPDTPEGKSVVIFSTPLKPRAFDIPSNQLARFKLSEIGYKKDMSKKLGRLKLPEVEYRTGEEA